MIHLSVIDIIQHPKAIVRQWGCKVFEVVSSHLEKGESVTLSFEMLDFVTFGFATESVGRLYRVFGKEIAERLIIANVHCDTCMWAINQAFLIATDKEHERIHNEALEYALSL